MKKKFFLYGFLFLIAALFVYYFFPEAALPANSRIDKIIVYKAKREMEVFSAGKLLKTYTISLGGEPEGDKQFQGDKRTPEGNYFIDGKNPNSVCYKNLGISYPSEQDKAEAKKLGKPAGGDIKIHGMWNGWGLVGKFHRWMDWTAGCIAVTDEEMDELYESVEEGVEIEIRP